MENYRDEFLPFYGFETRMKYITGLENFIKMSKKDSRIFFRCMSTILFGRDEFHIIYSNPFIICGFEYSWFMYLHNYFNI